MAATGEVLAAPGDRDELTVGELAEQIWRASGARRAGADIDLLGIRRGETLCEVLTGPGEELGAEPPPGHLPHRQRVPTSPARPGSPSACEARHEREEARAVWLEAMRRPGLLEPSRAGRPSRS